MQPIETLTLNVDSAKEHDTLSQSVTSLSSMKAALDSPGTECKEKNGCLETPRTCQDEGQPLLHLGSPEQP